MLAHRPPGLAVAPRETPKQTGSTGIVLMWSCDSGRRSRAKRTLVLRIRTNDDRGRVARLAIFAPARPGAGWPVVSVAAGTAGAMFELLRSRAGLSVVTMLTLTLCMLALLGLGGPFAAFLILFTPVASILILVAVNSLTSLGVLAGEAREALRSRWIAAYRCPSCAYDLAGAPIEADRCRQCPECGSAWRVDDVAETIVIVAGGGTPRGAGLRGSPATEPAASRDPAT
jgi:hypothetical protein